MLIEAQIPAEGTAGTDQHTEVGVVESESEVTAVRFLSNSAVVADNTNNRTFTLTNKGQDGSGSTAIATYQTNVAGGNLAQGDEKDFTLSSVDGATTVLAGDVLELTETHSGTGVAHGGGKLQIELTAVGE